LFQIGILLVFTQYGLEALATGLLLLQISRFVLVVPKMLKLFDLKIPSLLLIHRTNLLISALLILALSITKLLLPEFDILLINVGIEGIIFMLFWLALVKIFKHPIYPELMKILTFNRKQI
jgi:hypothetical protein